MNKKTVYFLNEIAFSKIKKGAWKYLLEKNFEIQTKIKPKKAIHLGHYITLYTTGKLVIRRGFMWDGSSFCADTDADMVASLVHDALCLLIEACLLSRHYIKKVNDLYRFLCKRDGMPEWRYKLRRLGLRLFSRKAIGKQISEAWRQELDIAFKKWAEKRAEASRMDQEAIDTVLRSDELADEADLNNQAYREGKMK